MKFIQRLLGAFFLTLSFCCFSQVSEGEFDYSLTTELHRKDKKIFFVKNSSYSFPMEIIDKKENAIKISSVDSTAVSWIGLGISVLSFVIAIFVPVYLNDRNNKKSVLDDFWARQVLYPEYLKPLLDYCQWVRININDQFDEVKSDYLNSYYSSFFDRLVHLHALANALKVNFDHSILESTHREMQDYVAKYINLLIDGSVIFRDVDMEKIIDSSQISEERKIRLLLGYKKKIDKLTNDLFNEFIKIMMNMQKGK
ncbi:hypothetical protein [Comamonas kerstersii]|nr:hypothetical protein [Comamonas kerstersii]